MRNQSNSLISQCCLFAIALISLMILSACSDTVDCEPASKAGQVTAVNDLPQDFENTGFDRQCEAAYREAWLTQQKELCDPSNAFAGAMQGQAQRMICDAPAYVRNHQLGANLYALVNEKEAIEKMLALGEQDGSLVTQGPSLRMRLRVLEREIPNLEALAQMRGLMEQTDLPPELRDSSSADKDG